MNTRRLLSLVLTTIVVGACTTDKTYFEALLDDPMADYKPLESELIRRIEQTGAGFIRQTPPVIISIYAIPEDADPFSVLGMATTEAMTNGWEFDELEPFENLSGSFALYGTKDLALRIEGKITIAVNPQEKEFSVRLTYPEPP